jgi:hypothetical protein
VSEQQAEEQANATVQRVLTLLAMYEAGRITASTMQESAAVAVYTGKIIASRLADIAVSALSNRPPVGITPSPDHVDRLETAVETILSEPESVSERLTRLAVAETLQSHRKSLHAAIRQQGFSNWKRIVQPDACEICEPLRDRIYSVDDGFKDHPGCHCTLLPSGQPISETKEATA